jgi:signal transduction histidine kinase/CHASE2 domain-containing sensor protein
VVATLALVVATLVDRAWQQLRWPLAVAALIVLLLAWRNTDSTAIGPFRLEPLEAFERLELMTHDVRFFLRGYHLASSDVVIVGITQQCLEELGEMPWPRSHYAKVIDALSEAGAALICLDVFFPTPTEPAEDAALVESTAKAANVMYPVFCPVALRHYSRGPFYNVDTLRTNLPELTRSCTGLGHINIPPSADGKCRATPFAIQHDGYAYPSLGIEAASRFAEITAKSGQMSAAAQALLRKNLPLTPTGDYLINYHGQHVTFDFCPLYKILQGRFPKELVGDKLVLIGQTALGQVNADLITTPHGEMYGVFVQGTIIDNLLTTNFVQRQSFPSAVLMSVLLSLAAGLVFRRLGANHLVFAWASSILLAFAISLFLFNVHGYLLELVPTFAVLTANFGLVVAVNLKESRDTVRHQEIELSSILKSTRFTADDLLYENAPQTLVALVSNIIGADYTTLHLRDRPGFWYCSGPAEQTGPRPTPPIRLEGIRAFEVEAVPDLLSREQVLLAENIGKDARYSSSGINTASFMSVPLVVRNEAIGLINFYNKRPSQVSPEHHFTSDDLRLIAVLGQQTALMLDNTGLTHDLTSKNQQLSEAMTRLKAAQEELVWKEKLSAVGEMAAMVIHDMRGPLTAAYGYVCLLQDTDVPDSQKKEYADRILRQLYRINHMAQEVLDFSKGTKKLELEAIEVDSLVAELVHRLHAELATNAVEIKTEVKCRASLRVDKEKILRVFLNLGRNASEAMDGHGALTITCTRRDVSVEFAVADNGPGIPPEIRETLFKPFVTAGKAKGTGLGLAIVQKIVKDHGGYIRAESEPGQGTTFFVSIPLPEFADMVGKSDEGEAASC